MTRRFWEHAGGRRLAEFGAGVGVAAVRDQDVVQVSHGSAPALIAVGETDRAAVLLLRLFLGGHLSTGRRRKCAGALVPDPRLGLADVAVLCGGRVIGMGRWNVVSLTTSHSDCAGCHLSVVVVKLPVQRFLLLTVSSLICLQVLEVVRLLLTAHVFSSMLMVVMVLMVFMCQKAAFCREAELNINSPRHTLRYRKPLNRLP